MDLLGGILVLGLGLYGIFQRKKILNAILSSDKIMKDRLHTSVHVSRPVELFVGFMIPFIGTILVIMGAIHIASILISIFTKQSSGS